MAPDHPGGDPAPTPRALVRHLDQYVIGQEEAKKTLAVAVYWHYRKIASARRTGAALAKSNILLVGPSGSGKTLLCETLSRALALPFVTGNATSLAQTRFVNDEIDAILARLIDKAGGELERAEKGIVFIDEIDKLRTQEGTGRGTSGESVQHALLKIMEGAPVKLQDGRHIDTTRMLFVCGGAFVGLDRIAARSQSYGYISTTGGEDDRILERLNTRVKPGDLFEFGLIPEFTGRLPIVATCQPLNRELLVRILTEPRDSVYRQFAEMLGSEGVELAVAARVFEQIADLALEYRTGARSLRGIFEEMLAPVLFVLPDHPEIRRVRIESLFEPARFN